MSHIALVRLVPSPVPCSLASLILNQIVQHDAAMPEPAQAPKDRPARARAWRVLSSGLWKMRTEPSTREASRDRLPWDRPDAPRDAGAAWPGAF